ncbi:tRNA glutamyl-Q(34) synthetase GluQRS [Defluviimonas sp. WL0024]|uniref:tRNA glutamyl-Q(34) synthetase GluQRS n=2 Tax=Albidovulum TaxID=205889 RepID=A0ABT3IXI3_9RHOB|nr:MULTISPECIES: tRNA glutamyl-Q(34) synthetase GluQRS [Defluviimonas]MCU9846569.1 tRNA glutamyl-Q(34) synthetase GluQRS [Defluviimonas sp. WL0024]MCW3780148.1 tRNA glutamyl-Q(34) synthetase GluQRS [Defluviimonas salinarum]
MRTRFAPSPTGPLHLGHAYSAILAHDMARAAGGTFLLRIEDTDTARARPEWEALIYEDLHWLGLDWPEPVLRQSDHLARYDAALDDLGRRGLIFPCSCTRADIRAALAAPQEGAMPTEGPYPGTCRHRLLSDRRDGDALRLDLGRAVAALGEDGPIGGFTETGPNHPGHHPLSAAGLAALHGDAVLGRKEIGTVSYALASVLDDATQGITHIIRGADLYEITFLQVLLQRLLDLPTPVYHHHRLIRDENGKRLAKRDDARAIRTYRDDGVRPEEIRRMVGLA